MKITVKNFYSLFISISMLLCSIIILSCEGEKMDIELIPEKGYGEFIDETTYRVFPTDADNFQAAEFRLWIPETTDPIRAVVVLTHSYNSNGLGFAYSSYWQNFAKNENVAILAVYLGNVSTSTNSYTDADGGSGKALLKSLEILAEEKGQGYIKDLPLLMRGYSAGGVFSYSFSGFLPERMLAFANIRGGSLNPTPENNNRIPGLLFYGENDSPQSNSRIVGVIAAKRIEGANWALVMEPGMDHFGPLEGPEDMIQSFFSTVLAKRLEPGTNKIKDIAEDEGWLGSNSKLEAYSFSDYPYGKTTASWLIDEDFAKSWLVFQAK